MGITWMMQRDDTPLRKSLTDAGEGRMKQRDRTEEKVRLLFQDNNKKKKRETEGRKLGGRGEDEERPQRDDRRKKHFRGAVVEPRREMKRMVRETEVIGDGSVSAVILTLFCIRGIRYSSLSIILLITSCMCSTIKAF